jgi:hypothetical protein
VQNLPKKPWQKEIFFPPSTMLKEKVNNDKQTLGLPQCEGLGQNVLQMHGL